MKISNWFETQIIFQLQGSFESFCLFTWTFHFGGMNTSQFKLAN